MSVLVRCVVPGCRGAVQEGYCNVCGSPPVPGGAQASPSQLAAQPLGSDRVGPDRPRLLSTSVARLRVQRLGAGVTTVAPTPVLAPTVMANPVVPEGHRRCSSCGVQVGQTRSDGPGRVEGFCPSCGARYDFR
ncbi:MAG: serine/threonine protein kinase, partial [Micrococcales bacterium]|nr:serine/threonine protein kinase [Micrococcales bacterium]